MYSPDNALADRKIDNSRTSLLVIGLLAALCWLPITLVALPAASLLILYLPGRFIVQLIKPLDNQAGRGWSALGASMLFVPLALQLVWMATCSRFWIWIAVVTVNVVLALLSRGSIVGHHAAMTSHPTVRRALGLLTLYVAVCVFCFYWTPLAGDRIAWSPSGDYIKHYAMLWSLDQYPLPLHNSFFAAASDAPYYYYHFHYLLPVAIRKLAGDGISLALAFAITSSLVAALFLSLVFCIAYRFLKSGGGALLATACTSIIGGWDIIPVFLRAIPRHFRIIIVLDSWNPWMLRIHNLADNFIWCPQHVFAVATLLLGVYWLQCAPAARWWALIAPLAAVSLFGTSFYQAVVIFAAVGIYLLWSGAVVPIGRTGSWKAFSICLASSVAALLAMLPRAWHYHVMARRYPGGLTWQWDRYDYAFLGRLVPPGVLANLLDAPWIILIEFGLPGVACLLVTKQVWKRVWSDPGLRLLGLTGGIGLVSMFIVRSSTTQLDYAFRSTVMAANVLAAIMAGAACRAESVRTAFQRWRVKIIVVGCLLGLPVGIYQLPVMAIRTILDKQFLPDAPAAMRYLRDELPASAVVQCDPVALGERPSSPAPEVGVHVPQITGRQMGVLDPEVPHILVFRPPRPADMYRAYEDIRKAFSTSQPSEASDLMTRWKVTHVLVGTDERRRYRGALQFGDARYFTPVFSDTNATIYRINTASSPAP